MAGTFGSWRIHTPDFGLTSFPSKDWSRLCMIGFYQGFAPILQNCSSFWTKFMAHFEVVAEFFSAQLTLSY